MPFLCAAVAAGALVISFAATLARFGSLPARVPISFDGAGAPRAFGPRPAIFFMVAIQAFTLVLQAAVVQQCLARPSGEVAAVLAAFVTASITVLLTVIQLQTLAIARGARQRTTNPLVFAVVVTVVALGAVGFGFLHGA